MSDVDTNLLREFFAQLKTTGEPQEVAVLHNHILVRAEKMADELDRLRAENALAQKRLNKAIKDYDIAYEELGKQDAQIAALKAKVERVAGLVDKQCCPDCADNLSAALAGEGE